MTIVSLFIQLAALVCFVFAAASLFSTPKVAWGWAGLFLWLLSLMISGVALHAAH